MSLTLGEKLRQAREERGFTLSEVAEQTRISSQYLESIENDDYRILPGGIFNKGFVKSFAKFVGINEADALSEYATLIAQNSTSEEDELKRYKPEVLTDDRSGSSMAPTIILAIVILGIMTAGILFLVDYMRQPSVPPVANTDARSNNNTGNQTQIESTPAPSNAPEMTSLKVEFRALNEAVALTVTNDGKLSSSVMAAGTTQTFEPRESLKLSYSKSLVNVVQLTINGKAISLPSQPLIPRRNAIEFEINKVNLGQIWTSGMISPDVPAATPADNANVANLPANTGPVVQSPVSAPVATPSRPIPVPKPSVAANTASPKPTPVKTPSTGPPSMTGKPPVANKP